MRVRRGGFTLVEIMIVVAIIGVLATMALAAFQRARRDSQNARISNDLRVAAHAFEVYCLEHQGQYPPDVNPGIVPAGMQPYLPRMNWQAPTVIGGQWDWDNGQFGFKAGVSVYRPTCSHDQLVEIDKLLDDGNLSTGLFRERTDGFIYIIEF